MTKEEYLDLKLDVIKAIEPENIKIPRKVPVNVYIQEAVDVYQWCREDKDALVAAGIDWSLVEDIPARSGALSAAEAIWSNERFKQEVAQRQWNQEYPAAYKLRDTLVHHFRFIFRDNKSQYSKVKDIAAGNRHTDMLQDLIELNILGKDNLELLTALNFDISLLERASQLSSGLPSIYAAANKEKLKDNESKKLRDQAYTHLKEAVDHVRKFGKYVFWQHAERLKGYRCAYYWRQRNKAKAREAEPVSTDTTKTANTTVTTNTTMPIPERKAA